jgi:hypothetical protein
MVVAMRATSQIGKSSADAWGRGSFCTQNHAEKVVFPISAIGSVEILQHDEVV